MNKSKRSGLGLSIRVLSDSPAEFAGGFQRPYAGGMETRQQASVKTNGFPVKKYPENPTIYSGLQWRPTGNHCDSCDRQILHLQREAQREGSPRIAAAAVYDRRPGRHPRDGLDVPCCIL